MPRPRSAASRAGAQMQGFQLTWARPGQSWWPNGQNSGLCSKMDTGTKMIMPSRAVSQSCLIGAAEVAGTRESQDDLQPSPAATWTVSTRRPQAVGNSLLLFA